VGETAGDAGSNPVWWNWLYHNPFGDDLVTTKHNNVLNQIELCKLAMHLEKIKDDLMKERPQASDLAERLSKEFGFTITKHNIRNLIDNGLCPDFRPPSRSHFAVINKENKLIREVETLRQIVEEQGKRIHNLEVQLGVEKLDSRLNGKHKTAM